MANRMFFFIALPGTFIAFIAFCLVVFTPRYMEYKPAVTKAGQMQHYRMGILQNCSRWVNTTETKTKKMKEVTVSVTKVVKGKKTTVKQKKKVAVTLKKTKYGKWKCKLNSWRVLTNQIFLFFLSTSAVAFFTLLGAFFVGIVKIILDWVPHDKIKAARILCSRNFGMGLMSAHITAGGFIIASVVLFVVWWKLLWAKAGWTIGFNIFLAVGVAVLSFVTAIMWFMDVRKMGLIPI